MEAIIFVLVLAGLGIAALRFGADSRDTLDTTEPLGWSALTNERLRAAELLAAELFRARARRQARA